MRVTVVTFPGSNCDRDVRHIFAGLGCDVKAAWHEDEQLAATDAVVLPGGFSYGDYLRTGAMAAHAKLMQQVRAFADKGGPVLGICNGFQILCEAQLLDGALLRNQSLQFICDDVEVTVESDDTPFSRGLKGRKLLLPIAHGEGNYFADEATLDKLESEGRVIFRYGEDNPNGSRRRIAGICNSKRNVVALMPHPERAADALLGRTDGKAILSSLLLGVA